MRKICLILFMLLSVQSAVAADRYWVGDTDTDWNDTNNWASTSGGSGGAGVPTSSDAVIFDSAYTTANCTCDVAIDIASIDAQASYDGILDFADSAYGHAIAGNATFDAVGTIDCGDSTITIGGNLDNKDTGINGTWTEGTSTIFMNGTTKTIITDRRCEFYKVTIDGTIELSSSTNAWATILNLLTVNVGKTFTINKQIALQHITLNGSIDGSGYVNSSSNWTVGASGSLTGLASFVSRAILDNSAGGTWSPTETSLKQWGTMNAGTYGGEFFFQKETAAGARTLTINGNLIFTGDVTFDNDNAAEQAYTVDMTGNHNLTFQGDVLVANSGASGAGLVWTKGTGDITFSGTANQDADFDGKSVEEIDIDKTGGTVSLTGGVTTDFFDLTDGIFDIKTQDMTCTGNFTQAQATTSQDTGGGGTITVGGNFAVNGASGFACTWNGPDLDITGTAVATWTTVTNSSASAGTTVTATDNCTDSGGNDAGWDFGAAGGFIAYPRPRGIRGGTGGTNGGFQ